MPFLSLAGMRIPVTTDQSNRNWEDSGRSSRGISGKLSKDRRFIKRRWEFRTQPISYADYTALIGILHGAAWSWRFDSNTVTNLQTDGLTSYGGTNLDYSSATGADGTPVQGGAKFGTAAFLPAGVGTNYLSANQATATDTSSNTTGFTAVSTATISSSTTRRWQGSRSFKVITTGSGQGFRTDAYSSLSGYRHTASLLVTGTALPLTIQLWANSTDLGSITVTPDPNTWKRVWIISTVNAPASPTDVHITVTQPGAGAGTYYFDGLQLERGNASGASANLSPWMASTRSQTTFTAHLATGAIWGTPEGVSLNAWVTRPYFPGGTIAQLIKAEGTTDPWPGLLLGCTQQTANTLTRSGLNVAFTATDGAQQNTTLTPTINWVDDYAFHMLTAVVRIHPEPGDPSMTLYVDGALAASSTVNLTSLDPLALSKLWIGQAGSNSPWSGPIDDVTVFPYPLSASAVSGIYQSNAPVPQTWPVITADGDAMKYGAARVSGHIEKVEFLPYYCGANGAVQSNAVQAGVVLMEA